MARATKTTIVAKTPKVTVGAQRQMVNTNYYKPSNTVLNAKQQSRLGRMQQRTTRQQIQAQKYAMNKVGGIVKQAGSAISEVTTPWAGAYSATRISEQSYASKARENAKVSQSSLSLWNTVIEGNPDKEKGAEGDSQTNSTSVLGG